MTDLPQSPYITVIEVACWQWNIQDAIEEAKILTEAVQSARVSIRGGTASHRVVIAVHTETNPKRG